MLGVATTNEGRVLRSRCARDARLLVVDDDEPVRTLYVALLENVAGVGPVVAAGDGADAVQVAKKLALDVAVLDLNMPRLDGIEAALALAALQPSLSIALHSSDPDTLRQRARGLDFAVFDKVEFDRLVAWVEGEVERLRLPRPVGSPDTRCDLSCSSCGYGVATDAPPAHCPMCNSATVWTDDGRGPSRAAGS